jgi:NitT/TauT family transport system substrate-binding protein
LDDARKIYAAAFNQGETVAPTGGTIKRILTFTALIVLVLTAACAAPTPTPTPKKSGTYRIGFTTEADFADLPSLMAHDVLRGQGYTVETQFFAGADLEVAALAQGDLDFGNGSTRTHWNANAKDAGLLTVMEEAGNAWSLVAAPDIKTCADLNEKRAAYSSAGALNAALLNAYIVQNCPEAKPQILLIANSSARASALLAGELDATTLELVDVMQLQQNAPDKFHTLVNFAEALPRLKTTGVHVRGEFARENPEMVRDYIRALLTIHRQIKTNPKLLTDAAVKVLKMDPADAERTTTAYLQNNIWNVNGGMTTEDVAYSVEFFTETGSLAEGLTAEKVSDLSYLDAVLKEIGRE